MKAEISRQLLMRFSEFVAAALGLNFPPSHWPGLQRGIVEMAEELGFEDVAACAESLMSKPLSQIQLETLVGNLTVGETYFFRDTKSLAILTDHVLPALLSERRKGERDLRIWSAACCTGEEPYSIAIALRRTIANWENLTLLATDINPRFLRKAASGVFGKWSFRNAPSWLKDEYFQTTPDGEIKILPEIKRMVQFAPLNLVEDVYPSPANNTNAMDVIFCRNVLMYFTPSQAQKVIDKLYRAQAEGGWLIVGPGELPQGSSTPYVAVNFDGSILYRKESGKRQAQYPPVGMEVQPFFTDQPLEIPDVASAPPTESAKPVAAQLAHDISEGNSDSYGRAMMLYQQGDYVEVVNTLRRSLSKRPPEPAAFKLSARALANQGKLHEAIKCCDQWIGADKLNRASYYLRAMILQEIGLIDEAVHSLRKALCLDPKFILAHFALGNIARDHGHVHKARKHLETALELTRVLSPDEVLPESEGIPASRFAEIIRSLIGAETVV